MSNERPARLTSKQRLLEEHLRLRLENLAHAQSIPRRPEGVRAELSFSQLRIWFLEQMAPGSATYTICRAFHLTGRLNLPALEQSVDEIVRRHEVLRTTFTTIADQPVQIIAPALTLAQELIDLRHVSPPGRMAEVDRQLAEEAQRPFDLAHGPLLRARVLVLGRDEHVLLLSLHHIVADGWSLDVFFRELSALYAAFAQGQPTTLHDPPIQYADFALWQRQWLQEAATAAQLAYWKRQLQGAPTLLELPSDRPRPRMQQFRGATEALTLSHELIPALQALSRQEHASLFMTLLAAFATLLYRYTGQTDLLIGTPIANRTRVELEGLIGCFVNTLVLRADLSGNPSFRACLRQLRETALAAYAHQDLPFEKLVEELQPERTLSHQPLVQVVFDLQEVSSAGLSLAGLAVRPLEIDYQIAKFDVTWLVRHGPRGVMVAVEYNTDLFDAPTIRHMVRHYQILLAGIVTDPDQYVSDLPLLGSDERRTLLGWNAPRPGVRSQESGVRSAPSDSGLLNSNSWCIHQLFEAQAARTPDAVAIVFDGRPPTTDHRPPTTDHRPPTSGSPLHPFTPSPLQSLTYRELNTRANRLAHHLHRLGVGPDVVVGVCVERSADLIVGLLAVLKAGGAYLPLDPAYPAERLRFMLADARAPVVLIQQQWSRKVAHVAAALVCLDDDQATQAMAAVGAPVSPVMLDHLAYVIYTSGSTGRPKGVQIAQRGLLNLVRWHQEAFAISPADRATQIAGVGFDACVWELWPYLTMGASIHIPDEATRVSTVQLRDWLVTAAITRSFLPTPLAENLLTLEWPERPALRTLFTGGDVLHSLPTGALAFELVNNYGPTENTVVTTSGRVQPLDDAYRSPSIGRPIANTQVYVLDMRLQLAPIGVPGELYIGGVGLARGYLGRPDLTAAAFIPNPFWGMGDGGWGMEDAAPIPYPPSPIPRLYRTGDLARYRPDGSLEFLGRVDQQVKIRGFRIELGEIEAVLTRHAAVREAVVLAREDVPGEKRLVAYVVPTNDQRPTTNDQRANTPDSSSVLSPQSSVLRTFLAERLPDYMVPAAWVLLDALPRTPNGKLDRRALPAPAATPPDRQVAWVAPRTLAETVVAQIWREVLGVAQIGVDDNFFELGGHSLRATHIVARIRQIFRIELTVRHMFEGPTIAALVRHMVALEAQPGSVEKTARVLQKVQQMSPLEKQQIKDLKQ